ncbi:uncharacterized protein LOC115610462 isoform X14 [Strigops habroptila]|uniref:uncharacterized protein LOC115610462 isoform X14 n=1 Tax=Strigops habroptila TaxID=2489341 RepID=UPI0011CF3FCC|nr:uncharacterized protein LOC115610462 isoform X14 [Strigops habroptila]
MFIRLSLKRSWCTFGGLHFAESRCVFTCNISLNVQCLSCSGVLRPSQWIGSSFGTEILQTPEKERGESISGDLED